MKAIDEFEYKIVKITVRLKENIPRSILYIVPENHE